MLKRRHRWMANARLPFQKGNPDAGRIRAMCGMCECKKSRFRAFAPQRGFAGGRTNGGLRRAGALPLHPA